MPIGTLSAEQEADLRQGKQYPVGKQGTVSLRLDTVTSVPVIGLSGKIMGGEAVTAIEALTEYLDSIPGYVIFNMHGLEYVSSTTLGFIARLALERHENGHDIFICNMGERVVWLLSVLDMNDFFQVRDTVEDAVSDALIRGTR